MYWRHRYSVHATSRDLETANEFEAQDGFVRYPANGHIVRAYVPWHTDLLSNSVFSATATSIIRVVALFGIDPTDITCKHSIIFLFPSESSSTFDTPHIEHCLYYAYSYQRRIGAVVILGGLYGHNLWQPTIVETSL